MLVAFAALLALGAVVMAFRELRAYRHRDQRDDLFRYSRRRLIRRLAGMIVLAGVAATLVVWELAPPDTPGAASVFVTLLMVEVAALVVIAVLDLRETSSTARFTKVD